MPREARSGRRPRPPRARPRAAGSAASLPARRRWGQHFLASPETARRIVEAAALEPDATVLEVGPGDGALTRALADRAGRLLAIEIDPKRAARLASALSEDPRVRIVAGNALDRRYGEWLAGEGFPGPAVLVANLPYNAATPLVTRAVEEPEAISRAVVTVQREVARRLSARPGDADYGYLSVRTAAAARARILFDLPPGAFRPAPRVVSSVVALAPRDAPLDPVLGRRALRLASLAFRARRKTLANALSAVAPRDVWQAALAAIGRGPLARAEELSLEDYLALAARVP